MSYLSCLGDLIDSFSEGEGLSTGVSVFDTLRDTIYSEVATLIASNENRPHFLVSEPSRARIPSPHCFISLPPLSLLQVELFRELQMLNTDYLRQRALYNLQELVTRYLTEEAVANQAKDKARTHHYHHHHHHHHTVALVALTDLLCCFVFCVLAVQGVAGGS